MTRAQGIKKSNFPAKTSIPSASTFDYVSGGVNYKITIEDMLTAFGTTGTLQQEGAVSGVPVLDDQGIVKGIRNIEPGAGLVASVSAENGVSIASGIQQNVAGDASLFDDLTISNPTAASFVGGSGMTITKADDQITFDAAGGLANRS